MSELKKLCDDCSWFVPERQLCFESGRYMIAKATHCSEYDRIWVEEEKPQDTALYASLRR